MAARVEFGSSTWQQQVHGGRTWVRPLLRVMTTVVLTAVVAFVTSVAYETGAYADRMSGRLLPGATINGVDVGGLTVGEAREALTLMVAPQLERSVRITFGDRSWETTPAALGTVTDLERALADASSLAGAAAYVDLVRMRWLDEQRPFTRDVALMHSPDAVRAFVDAIAAEVNTEPADAVLDTSTGWVNIIPARAGVVVDTEATAAALLEALETEAAEVPLATHQTAPAVTADAFEQVLLVRQREHKLYLYERGEITHEWVITTGTGRYPTPTGIFRIGAKRYLPTWVNPAPNGWGKGMPASIGPGAGNPLGLRALNWLTPEGHDTAIRFHGTQAVNQLGRDGSHGCVRLSNRDVIQLFDLVREGATIVSVR